MALSRGYSNLDFLRPRPDLDPLLLSLSNHLFIGTDSNSQETKARRECSLFGPAICT